MLIDQQIKNVVLDRSIPSAARYTACKSHTEMVGDPSIQTNRKSTKIFALADGHLTPATIIALLEHKIRDPARTLNMVPALANQSLLSKGKFSEAGYI